MDHFARFTRALPRASAAAVALGAALFVTADARLVDAAVASVSRATGVTFSYRITSSAADRKQREARDLLATVRLQDANIRMDYVEGKNPIGQKNGYTIVQGDKGLFYIVNPKDKQAILMTADGFGSGFGALMNNPMLKMTISNTSFRFRDLGAGEEILGYVTRKVRTYYTSTIEMKMLLINNKTTTSDSSDQWIAKVDFDPGSLEAWAKSFASGVKSSNPELAADLAKYTNEYGRTGMALRSVTWSTQTDKKGKVTADTLTMEVTDIKTGALDASLFKVPDGFEVLDMSKLMQGAGGMK